MQDYTNCLVWVSRISDLIPKIEESSDIKIDYSNYKNIFNNLNDYIDIDDAILNTNHNSFLIDLYKTSIKLPKHNFLVFIADSIQEKDVKNFKLCRNYTGHGECKIDEIRSDILDGLSKFFEKSGSEISKYIDNKIYHSDDSIHKNIHFIDFKTASEKALENFSEIVQNEENKDELINRFNSSLKNFINFESCKLRTSSIAQNMSFKIDLLKILGFLSDNHENFLIQDFDRMQLSNIDINEISKDFPKFCLVESNNKNHQDLFDTGIKINSSWIPEQIFYLPETAKKIFCMFFEHTMNNLQDKNSLNNYMGVGGRLEVLFEYLDSKNFKKNDDIINFIENTSYNQIYDEFDLKFKKFQKSKTNELNFNMKNSHEKQMNNFNNNMHLMFSDGIKDFIIERIPGSKQIKYADSWIKKLNHIEKLSIKNNFFDQINNIENNSNYTFT